jgi:cell fate (sporulation/competence/biofilm development) regulator YlbF (YheA/YmcA/DUF963 family)
MRNVHLITKEQEGADVLHQYLYITSNEKIKQGDWCIYDSGEVIQYLVKLNTDNLKKIILTDNPDLIAEGVQPIDNEFLEWFVKNPSCEFINIESWKIDKEWDVIYQHFNPIYPQKTKYQIILPQEEPKQIKCYCGHTITCDCEPLQETLEEAAEEAKQRAENYMRLKGALEPKQETLEEAAERMSIGIREEVSNHFPNVRKMVPQQTALELVISQLKEHITQSAHNQLGTNRTGDYRIGLVKAIDFCEQAKEMEKQQIIDACNLQRNDYKGQPTYNKSGEQYYNETFNKNL